MEFVNGETLGVMQPTQSDVLVDIGCGDAFLPTRADGRVLECLGIAGTHNREGEIGDRSSQSLRPLAGAAHNLLLGVRQCLQDRLRWRPTSGPG